MDKKSWHRLCLEKIPHGEEGRIDLNWDDAVTWAKILNKHGYAVLLTGGDMEDAVKVSWLYAGTVENLDWADYDMVTFTSPEYLEDYPDMINEEEENEDGTDRQEETD